MSVDHQTLGQAPPGVNDLQQEKQPSVQHPVPPKAPNIDEFKEIDIASDPLDYSTCSIENAPPGYPMLARFTSTAPEFYIFREFRYLQSRALLHLQDELRALETQLYRMDERDRTKEPRLLHCREYDDMYRGQRKVMMELVNKKLVQYGELMEISRKLAALEQPSKFERLSVEHFFQHRQPLVLQENYMGNRADLITLKAERDDAWLDNQILRFLVAANSRLLTWVFADRETTNFQAGGGPAIVYSMKRIKVFVMCLLIFTMIFLFSAPLVPLYEWSQSGTDGIVLAKMMGFQVGCTLVFGTVLALSTRAKKHEIFGACAGYVAILVIFMGQNSGST